MAQEWIKASERLPESEGLYLVVYEFGSKEKRVGTCEFTKDLSNIDEIEFGADHRPGWFDYTPDFYNEQNCFYEIDVIYWMPFPEAPDY